MRSLLILLLILPTLCFGLDKHKLDSLNQIVVNAKEDSTKVNALLILGGIFIFNDFKISEEYYKKALVLSENIEDKNKKAYALLGLGSNSSQTGNYDEAIKYNEKSLNIFSQLNNKFGAAKAIRNHGSILYKQGNFSEAMIKSKLALEYLEDINNAAEKAHTLNDIANIYVDIGHYKIAIEYYTKSHNIYKEIAFKRGIAGTLLNLAAIDDKQGNHKLSLEKHKESLSLFKEHGTKTDLTYTLNSIGNIYINLKNNKQAMASFIESLELSKSINQVSTIAANHMGLGTIALNEEKYNKALTHFSKSLKISEKSGQKKLIGETLLKIAEVQLKQKNHNKSIELCNKVLLLSKKENVIQNMKEAHYMLYEIYTKSNNDKKALKNFKLYIEMKDSLKTEAIDQQLMRLKFDNELLEKDQQIASEKEKNAVFERKEIENKYTTRIGAIVIITLIVITIVILFNFMLNKKKNKIINQKNLLLQKTNTDLDRKNKKINESIEYASNIQKGYLPLIKDLEKHFEDIFIYYEPRDIVSGDFYWFAKKNDTMIIAACDCTGHGVPGSMVSMLGNGLFNKIVNDMNILNPGKILELLHKEFLAAFHKDSNNSNTNGMDCSVLSINKKEQKVQFSGAVNPLYIIKDNELNIIKADIWSIGGGGLNRPNTKYTERSFNCHELILDNGAQYFMFSDGFVDQFGGKNNRKFNKKRFDQLLIDISPLSAKEQKLQLEHKMDAWMKTSKNGQIDDMLVIGFRV